MERVVDGAYRIALGNSNAYLLDAGPELVLVDAGFPDKASLVFDAIRRLGRSTSDLRHIVFTHGHPDHIGSAMALVRETGARTYMHPADVSLAEAGGPFRPMTPGRGVIAKIAYRLFWRPDERMEPFAIDQTFVDGDTLPLAGGLRVVHLPGHCAGQVALLWQGARLLIAGDVCMNLMTLGDPLGFEDAEAGHLSQRRLADLRFDAICFGHGKPIVSGARDRVRRAFSG